MKVANDLVDVYMYLTSDAYSSMNPKKLYGAKGDRVLLRKYRGSVAIVEMKENHGFPVKAEQLSLTKK